MLQMKSATSPRLEARRREGAQFGWNTSSLPGTLSLSEELITTIINRMHDLHCRLALLTCTVLWLITVPLFGIAAVHVLAERTVLVSRSVNHIWFQFPIINVESFQWYNVVVFCWMEIKPGMVALCPWLEDFYSRGREGWFYLYLLPALLPLWIIWINKTWSLVKSIGSTKLCLHNHK